MCVSTINGETNNHMIQEKEPTRKQAIFAMDDSAVMLRRDPVKPSVAPIDFPGHTVTKSGTGEIPVSK